MRSRKVVRNISIAVIVILVIIGLIILGLYIAYERKDRIEYYENGENIYDYENERTNEEYMAVLTDNQEDFEYVAQIMQQWDEGSIYFADAYGSPLEFADLIIRSSEIESEMSSNIDFYNSLHNLYNLDEIDDIIISEQDIMFSFSKPPQGCSRSGLAFIKDKERYSRKTRIDENWDLIIWGDT